MEVRQFVFGSQEYEDALNLRYRILREPLRLKFTVAELKKDESDWHVGVFENGKIVGCLILSGRDATRMKMRQVAVDEAYQGKGIGKMMSDAAERMARNAGYKIMFCHARKTAVPFYRQLGYKTIGDEFMEVNIPHYVMEKHL